MKYAIRMRYAGRDCMGTAAVAEALELDVCQPWATHDLSILFTVEDGLIFTREYANEDCAGKPASEIKSHVDKSCARSRDNQDSSGAAYSFNWAFADSLPAVSLGYPYMQTNYTSSDVCNKTTFSTSLLFHRDTANTCIPGSFVNFPAAKAIWLTPATNGGFSPHFFSDLDSGSTAFSLSYFEDKLCKQNIQELVCPNHCNCTTDANGTFFTSRHCLAEAGIVTANTAQLVWISVGALVGAVFLGAAMFTYMRRRAHGLPQRGKELWAEAEENGMSHQEYSTF